MKTSDRKRGGGQPSFTPEEQNVLDEVLAALKADVADNHLPYLGSAGERMGMVHASWCDLGKAMRRPRTCMYPGCVEMSVPRSHTIQKAGSLSLIAENSHVITPSFASDASGFSVERVGLKDASTFPGFCEAHELLFQEFETAGGITTERDIRLQVFRTICREIAVKQVQLAQLRKMRATHDRLVSSKAFGILRERLGAEFLSRHRIVGVSFEKVSKAQLGMLGEEEILDGVIRGLQDEFLPAAAADLSGSADSLYHYAITVQQPLPVCLAGIANFWIDDQGDRRSVRTILHVLPSREETLMIATTKAIYARYLENYIAYMLNRKNGPLRLLETWMIRGTDHWFMAPGEWQAIPERRKAKVLSEMFDESVSIGGPSKTQLFVRSRLKKWTAVRKRG